MRRAASTWSGEWWKAGGGGTAWDTIVYDPETEFVFFGTGNGSPWYDRLRDDRSDIEVVAFAAQPVIPGGASPGAEEAGLRCRIGHNVAPRRSPSPDRPTLLRPRPCPR